MDGTVFSSGRVGGVNVHVGSATLPELKTVLAFFGRDRKRLERLCRYMTRPPVCQERLEKAGSVFSSGRVTRSGQVVYRFKRAWRSGAHAVVLDPLDLIARLAALIPPPHFNLTRYHGIFAAFAKDRADVVPGPAAKEPEPVQLQLVLEAEPLAKAPDEVEAKPASRHPWAWLLQRVFAADVMTCPRCRSAMRLVKIANTPDEVAQVLAELGLGPRPPPRPRPSLPGQLELVFAG